MWVLIDLAKASDEKIFKILRLKKRVAQLDAENCVDFYRPYEFQREFHRRGGDCDQRLLMCANQVGKTEAGRFEISYHATGRYPEWWDGRRFNRPVLIWACGTTNELTRDVVQERLFGDPSDPASFGTGSIPKSCLDYSRVIKKPQVPNAYQSVPVRHVSGGWSVVVLKSYEAKKKAFMSRAVDVISLDEEPPSDIMNQCLVRQVNRPNSILFMTFTPEYGMTDVVTQFMQDLKPGQALIQATWDDAPHLTKEKREQILGALPVWERDMRSKGIPIFGSGLVFPIVDEEIMCDAFKIPEHYYLVAGLDFGSWNWPTACSWVAWDRESDVVYVYATYKAQEKALAVHAQAINAHGRHIPVIYPHDAEKGDRGTGVKLAQQYRDLGVRMHYTHFTNPPSEDEEEGEGGNAVDPGLIEMFNRMQSGRLKVFSHLQDWFKEKRMYHTQDGKLVRKHDDLMSATRYAVMSLRFSKPKELMQSSRPFRVNSSFNAFDSLFQN